MNLRTTICATILFSACGLFAAPNYWINPGQGQFNDPANWSSNSVPAGSDDARVNNGGTAIIDSSMTLSMSLLQIADTNTTTGTVRMTGGSLTLSSDLRAGGNSATAGGTGVFQLEDGAVLVTGGNLNVGFGTNNANGTYNIYGGSIQCNAANPIFAVGNRGTGTVNQTNGTVYLRGLNGLTQLGRNVANGFGFGTYYLGGGELDTAKLAFGNAVQTNGVSTNIFTLADGFLRCNSITNINTNAVNIFNFIGGYLMATNCAISLSNNGGSLEVGTPDFATATTGTVGVNAIGTMTFSGANSYFQNTNGRLYLDVTSPGTYDSLNIGLSGSATLSGYIFINFINYLPDAGTTFDIVTAGSITTNHMGVFGYGSSGAEFSSALVTGGDGRQILRVTVTVQPVVAIYPTIKIVSGLPQLSFTNTPGHGSSFRVLSVPTVPNPFIFAGFANEVSPGQYQFTDSSLGASKYYTARFVPKVISLP